MGCEETRADSHVGCLEGIGPKRAAALEEAGFGTVGELLYHLPLRYEDKRAVSAVDEALPGVKALFRVKVTSVDQGRVGRGGRLHRLLAHAGDEQGGSVTLRWLNQPFRSRSMESGACFFVYGAVQPAGSGSNADGLMIDNPELEPDPEPGRPLGEGVHLGRIIPVYRRVGLVGSRVMRAALHRLLASGDRLQIASSKADEALRRHGFPDSAELLRGVHCPPSFSDPAMLDSGASIWHRGLAFEELYLQQRALAGKRRQRLDSRKRDDQANGPPFPGTEDLLGGIEELTGFELTGDQRSAIVDVVLDMGRAWPMRRLLQGEVGSGKTVVAYAALIHGALAGLQTALMVPTEALAWQHYQRLEKLFQSAKTKLPLRGLAERTILVTGGNDAEQRRRLETKLAGPGALIVIGTHALLSSAVEFRDLALAVVDEQQRFGVGQRERLRSKGTNPDQLVISATPIPRTMGLRLCGDMDLSRIGDLPLGRREVKTICLASGNSAEALVLLERELRAGRQGFVVCPVVRDRGGREKRAAESVFRRIRSGRLAGYQAGLLHGGLDLAEARSVMERFADGSLRLLVTTTVVEVGLDVPRATVMVVLEPERFGLSQLHQLRGRIGRGKWPGWFILLRSSDDTKSEAGQRLAVLASSDDGFHIAEQDLRLRGSGELTGERQAGSAGWRMTASTTDNRLLDLARAEAFRVFSLNQDA